MTIETNTRNAPQTCPPLLLLASLAAFPFFCHLMASTIPLPPRLCAPAPPPYQNNRFGIRNALLRDPAGYLVEIQQFMDPAEHSRFTV